MSKEIKKSLVPKLRFPEFRDAGEWDIDEIKNICLITTGDKNTQDRKDSGRYPFFIRSQQIEKIDTYSFDGEAVLTAGDGGVGKIFHYINGKFDFHQRVYKMSNFSNRVNGFYFYKYFSHHFYIRVMSMSAKTTVDSVRMEMISDMQILLPKIKEQETIADCLSSVDDLITAQTQKIDALKAHKKGLMQKLFPAEGETVPKLRFPEFRDAGEWEEKHLGKLSTILRGGSPRPINAFLTSDINGLNWLKIGDVDKESKFITQTSERVKKDALKKTREVNPGDLIMSNSMSFGRPYILKIKSCIHDGWIAVTCIKDSIDSNYLYYLILSNPSQAYFLNSAAGGVVKNLSIEIIKLLSVAFPKKAEQKAIADCLSSVDDLITTQTQKIDALKAHKKGLMQRLFPSH